MSSHSTERCYSLVTDYRLFYSGQRLQWGEQTVSKLTTTNQIDEVSKLFGEGE